MIECTRENEGLRLDGCRGNAFVQEGRQTGGRVLSPSDAIEALSGIKDSLGFAPEGLIEGKNGVINYSPVNIVEIADSLSTLVEAHGEGHNLFTDPYMGPERTMLMRVIAGKGDQYTASWFHHEATEARLLRGQSGLPGPIYLLTQEQAHINTLNAHGNSSTSIYHPSVVRAYNNQFGPAYPRE